MLRRCCQQPDSIVSLCELESRGDWSVAVTVCRLLQQQNASESKSHPFFQCVNISRIRYSHNVNQRRSDDAQTSANDEFKDSLFLTDLVDLTQSRSSSISAYLIRLTVCLCNGSKIWFVKIAHGRTFGRRALLWDCDFGWSNHAFEV